MHFEWLKGHIQGPLPIRISRRERMMLRADHRNILNDLEEY